MSLILFYLFIWIGIIKCIYGLFDPTMMGTITCFLPKDDKDDNKDNHRPIFFLVARGLFLYALGFLCYVDQGGLHSWNVRFLAVVCLAWICMVERTFSNLEDAVYEECVGNYGNLVWVSVVWIILFVVGTFIDEKMADNGTAEERASLAKMVHITSAPV